MPRRRESKEIFQIRGARDIPDLERQLNSVLNRLSTYIDERAGFAGPVGLNDDLDTKGKRVRNLPVPKEGSEPQRADRALSIGEIREGILQGQFFNAKDLRIQDVDDAVRDRDAVNLGQVRRLIGGEGADSGGGGNGGGGGGGTGEFVLAHQIAITNDIASPADLWGGFDGVGFDSLLFLSTSGRKGDGDGAAVYAHDDANGDSDWTQEFFDASIEMANKIRDWEDTGGTRKLYVFMEGPGGGQSTLIARDSGAATYTFESIPFSGNTVGGRGLGVDYWNFGNEDLKHGQTTDWSPPGSTGEVRTKDKTTGGYSLVRSIADQLPWDLEFEEDPGNPSILWELWDDRTFRGGSAVAHSGNPIDAAWFPGSGKMYVARFATSQLVEYDSGSNSWNVVHNVGGTIDHVLYVPRNDGELWVTGFDPFEVWKSTDGTSWTKVFSEAYSTGTDNNHITAVGFYKGRIWVAARNEDDNQINIYREDFSTTSQITSDQESTSSTSDEFAKKDHTHETDTAEASDLADVDHAAAAEGTSSSIPRGDHKHSVDSGLAGDIAAVDHTAAAAGTSDRIARADHKHSVTSGIAGDIADVDHAAAAAGTSDSIARADHKHSVTSGVAGDIAAVDHAAAAAGASDSIARADHKHSLSTAAAGVLADVDHAAAAAGASDDVARGDHKHSLNSAAAGDLARPGLNADAGTSDTVARGDHVHPATALLAMDPTDTSHTGDFLETQLHAATLVGNTLGTDRALMVFYRLSVTNGGSPGTKTVRFKFGGTTLFTITIASGDTDSRWVWWWILPDGGTSAQESFLLSLAALSPEVNGRATSALDTTVNQDVEVTVQLADAGDTVTGQAFVVEVKTSP